MKAVMLSIRPQWCELICNGKKTIEVRKTRPKLETPFKCYIYCTQDKVHTLFKDWIDPPFVVREYNIMNGKGVKNVFADNRPWGNANGKVIGEFVCDSFHYMQNCITGEFYAEGTCLTPEQIEEYCGNSHTLYGWHISALQIYDKPKELSEFFRYCTEKDDCHKCIHWDSSYDNTYYEPPDPPFEGCRTGEKKYFTRPPQSWAYIEELDGNWRRKL